MPQPYRQNISGQSPWEDIVGYSRMVITGDLVEVAGTTAIKDGKPYAIGDAYEQTRYILQCLKELFIKEGIPFETIYRTQLFVTDISQWEAVGRAHGEFFKNIKPVATMVEVSSLIDEDLLVEIEVFAKLNKTRSDYGNPSRTSQ